VHLGDATETVQLSKIGLQKMRENVLPTYGSMKRALEGNSWREPGIARAGK
jgi:hypothetical protein